jgi:hypothetical protein
MNDFIADKRSDKYPPELLQAWADCNDLDLADERVQFGWTCGWPDQFNAFVAGWMARTSIVNLRQRIAEMPIVDFDSEGEGLIRRDDVLALLKNGESIGDSTRAVTRWELDTVDYQALEDFLFPKQEEAE